MPSGMKRKNLFCEQFIQIPFNTNLPLKQATDVLFDLLQEMFKRIKKPTKYFIIFVGMNIFLL
jgi:hypothetical protein